MNQPGVMKPRFATEQLPSEVNCSDVRGGRYRYIPLQRLVQENHLDLVLGNPFQKE